MSGGGYIIWRWRKEMGLAVGAWYVDGGGRYRRKMYVLVLCQACYELALYVAYVVMSSK